MFAASTADPTCFVLLSVAILLRRAKDAPPNTAMFVPAGAGRNHNHAVKRCRRALLHQLCRRDGGGGSPTLIGLIVVAAVVGFVVLGIYLYVKQWDSHRSRPKRPHGSSKSRSKSRKHSVPMEWSPDGGGGDKDPPLTDPPWTPRRNVFDVVGDQTSQPRQVPRPDIDMPPPQPPQRVHVNR